MNLKDRLLNIFIKGFEKRCLGPKYITTLLLCGVGLISTSLIDLLSNFLGIQNDVYQNVVGTILILLSIFLYINDKSSTVNFESKDIDHQADTGNGIATLHRREKVINKRINVLLMILGLLLLIIAFCIMIYKIVSGPLGFGIGLILFILLFSPVFYIGCLIFHLKDRKLLIVNKEYNLEYGNDANLYLTGYDFKCPSCQGKHKSHLSFAQNIQQYYLQCNEYNNHKNQINISDFDKYSNP